MPKAIRTKLGVKAKDKVAIRLEQGEVKVTPTRATVDSIDQMGGALKTPLSDKEMVHIAQEEQAQKVLKADVLRYAAEFHRLDDKIRLLSR
jgi:hypothetical protein